VKAGDGDAGSYLAVHLSTIAVSYDARRDKRSRQPQPSRDETIVLCPEEEATVRRISELRREGRSLREIAAVLTSEGYKPKRSDRWHPESLRRIVARL
jgi:hypothetical protein